MIFAKFQQDKCLHLAFHILSLYFSSIFTVSLLFGRSSIPFHCVRAAGCYY